MGGIIGKSYSNDLYYGVLAGRGSIYRLTLAPNFNVVSKSTETFELLRSTVQRRSSRSMICNIEIWERGGEGANALDGTGRSSE